MSKHSQGRKICQCAEGSRKIPREVVIREIPTRKYSDALFSVNMKTIHIQGMSVSLMLLLALKRTKTNQL